MQSDHCVVIALPTRIILVLLNKLKIASQPKCHDGMAWRGITTASSIPHTI